MAANLLFNRYSEQKTMIIKQIIVGSMAVCCYIVACERTKKAAVVDPGGDVEIILAEVEKMRVQFVQDQQQQVTEYRNEILGQPQAEELSP